MTNILRWNINIITKNRIIQIYYRADGLLLIAYHDGFYNIFNVDNFFRIYIFF